MYVNMCIAGELMRWATMWRKLWYYEMQHSKFYIQLNESTFDSWNIFTAYVRYNSPSLKCIIDEVLIAKYLRADSKGETILPYLEDYWNTLSSVPLEDITAQWPPTERQQQWLVATEVCILAERKGSPHCANNWLWITRKQPGSQATW